jgi:glucokinase
MEIVAVDIGGTHARFALAEVSGGQVVHLGEALTMRTGEHASLRTAWQAFGEHVGHPLPTAAGVAIACPINQPLLKLTNNPWTIRPASIAEDLAVERFVLVNDFGAVGHALAHLDAEQIEHVCGPDRPLPTRGVVSVIGPGTGLGVAYALRDAGKSWICETEGGHVDFAPLDPIEDAIAQSLRRRHRRVSVERLVSGPGLSAIYEALAMIEKRPLRYVTDQAVWAAAIEGVDALAAAALERFCLIFGAVSGDIALAQGARAVVLAGALARRLAPILTDFGFPARFVAKGRFERMMADIPVKLITHPQPGLLGAAGAFAADEHCKIGPDHPKGLVSLRF